MVTTEERPVGETSMDTQWRARVAPGSAPVQPSAGQGGADKIDWNPLKVAGVALAGNDRQVEALSHDASDLAKTEWTRRMDAMKSSRDVQRSGK